MHDRALVNAATDQVHQYSDQYYDTEDTARAEGLLLDVYAAAGVRRAAFKEVDAVVYRGDEGDGGFGKRVGVAEERDYGGFTALGVRLLSAVLVFVIFIVIIAVDDFAWGELDREGAARGGGRGT